MIYEVYKHALYRVGTKQSRAVHSVSVYWYVDFWGRVLFVLYEIQQISDK